MGGFLLYNVGFAFAICIVLVIANGNSSPEATNENRAIFSGDLNLLKSKADYLNKLTRHAGVAKAVLASNFEPDSDLAKMAHMYRKKCPGSIIVLPKPGEVAGNPGVNSRREVCAVEVPVNTVTVGPVGLPRQSTDLDAMARGNNYEAACVCQG